jgi:hypothetical protein
MHYYELVEDTVSERISHVSRIPLRVQELRSVPHVSMAVSSTTVQQVRSPMSRYPIPQGTPVHYRTDLLGTLQDQPPHRLPNPFRSLRLVPPDLK